MTRTASMSSLPCSLSVAMVEHDASKLAAWGSAGPTGRSITAITCNRYHTYSLNQPILKPHSMRSIYMNDLGEVDPDNQYT